MWFSNRLFLLLCCFSIGGIVHGLVVASSSPASALSGKKVVVVGGGPVGLYFACYMSQQDPTVSIEILEKRNNTTSVNAFGLGVGFRMQNRLRDVPGLYEQAISISTMIDALGIPLVSRDDLTQQMSRFVLDNFSENCKLVTGEECVSVDFDLKQVTTSSGRRIPYDLLLGADGVNSKIRQLLVQNFGLKEEHYLEDARWKALTLPKQPDIEVGSFKPLRHPLVAGGRVLPRAPEGHVLLLFWKDEHGGNDNPNGIETTFDLKQMITEAMQDSKKSKFPKNVVRSLLGLEQGDSIKRDRKVEFDEAALQDFIESRAGRSHHLQIPQYHYGDSVALIGDSAHAFNSLLGQGCATGLESTHALVQALTTFNTTVEEALTNYTSVATVQAHAMTELSLISYATTPGLTLMKVKALPLVVWNLIRGKGLIQRLMDINVPFSQIEEENKRLLTLCRREFETKRRPYTN